MFTPSTTARPPEIFTSWSVARTVSTFGAAAEDRFGMETGAVWLIMVSAGLLRARTETAQAELRLFLLRLSFRWPDLPSFPDEFLCGLGRELSVGCSG